MTSRDQTLGELIYVIFHSARIGVQKIADHKNAVFDTNTRIPTIGTSKTHHHGSCWFVEPKLRRKLRLQHCSEESEYGPINRHCFLDSFCR